MTLICESHLNLICFPNLVNIALVDIELSYFLKSRDHVSTVSVHVKLVSDVTVPQLVGANQIR